MHLPYCQLLGDFTLSENLNAVLALGQNAGLQQGLRIHFRAILEPFQSRYVDSFQRFCKYIVESSLRDAAGKRHLATFKSDPGSAAASGLLTFMAAAGRLAVSRCVASAFALGHVGGTFGRRKFVDIHSQALLILL